MNEFDLIQKYFAPLSVNEPGSLSLSDDAAFLTPKAGYDLVITKDAMVEGIHFFVNDPPPAIARRLMRSNLSDLAAKGAVPRAYLLAIMLRDDIDSDWVASFTATLQQEQDLFGITLIGGDTVIGGKQLMLSLTAIGETDKMLFRKGAKADDLLCVSGTIGDAAFYYSLRQEGYSDAITASFAAKFYDFKPRLALGQMIGKFDIRAAADISDGLVADLDHICRASGVGADLYACDLPLSPAVSAILMREPQRLALILTGGDDYELVFAAPPNCDLIALQKITATPITIIGKFTKQTGIIVKDKYDQRISLTKTGWLHSLSK